MVEKWTMLRQYVQNVDCLYTQTNDIGPSGLRKSERERERWKCARWLRSVFVRKFTHSLSFGSLLVYSLR